LNIRGKKRRADCLPTLIETWLLLREAARHCSGTFAEAAVGWHDKAAPIHFDDPLTGEREAVPQHTEIRDELNLSRPSRDGTWRQQ
jgi:hypothetical protein